MRPVGDTTATGTRAWGWKGRAVLASLVDLGNKGELVDVVGGIGGGRGPDVEELSDGCPDEHDGQCVVSELQRQRVLWMEKEDHSHHDPRCWQKLCKEDLMRNDS